MIIKNHPELNSLEWRTATYYGKPIGDWLVSENGVLYNPVTEKLKYGHDNIKGRDLHQRVSIKHRQYYISRIVAEAFVYNDNPKINIVVRHLNDDPLNNHYSNLVWGTHRENTMDGIRNGKIVYDEHRNYAKGETHGCAILTEKDVLGIIKMFYLKKPIAMIARKYNVDPSVIYHIYNGNSWRHLTEKHLPFPKPINRLSRSTPIPNDIRNKIQEMIMDDINVYPSEVIRALNLKDTNQIRSFIGYTKRRLKKKSVGFNDQRKLYTH